ncbi:nitroreductase family deazaflavin-dependent oxidoreductase [Actinomadura atramentaria]|uniref:nitroreductase family deazaflavin-dependent oxidoreductase n=1 Tax=Actinomadura atramentaria TaxID=1990 RepID=UPI00038174DF|nr:nitroreductase family deazaflavin-dependent oxidoreductase [Actinomadura atramentaria]
MNAHAAEPVRNVQAREGGEVFFNKVVAWLARHGVSLLGTRLLAVRGRKSGVWRTTPVNLMTLEDERYIVAPRGHTQWVRNMRAAGGGELRLGRRAEEFTVTELTDAEKIPMLRTYFKRWGWEVARFFDRPIKNLTDAELAELAPGVPVFRLA